MSSRTTVNVHKTYTKRIIYANTVGIYALFMKRASSLDFYRLVEYN
jgi:hypothetical protein